MLPDRAGLYEMIDAYVDRHRARLLASAEDPGTFFVKTVAEMTGTTLHTVSRILTAWEHAGLVEGGRQKLLVKDAHQLVLIGDGHAPGLLQ